MALLIVVDACHFTPDRARGVVTVESDCPGPNFGDAFHELDSQEARALAQELSHSFTLASKKISIAGTDPIAGRGFISWPQFACSPLLVVRGSTYARCSFASHRQLGVLAELPN